ncbi:MAG: DNA gyrase subunit A [Armatimonadetes bacterium]|nr:DNA gyrase subunit A [Armatimonadota bacterium]
MAIGNDNIIEVNIEDELRQSYLLYSMSVIVGRAFPDVRDGLKPVQRRILMAMHDLNLGPGAQHRKSAKVSGDTSGNYHPHGDQVIYPTIVRMAQEFNARYPLVDGQGNMGSIDGDPPAAQRYTEVRMSPYAIEMLADIDQDTVDWTANYDQTRQEPTVLPGRFPNLLANGSSGIGVGIATNIPPHNLTELCNAIMLLIDKPESNVDDILGVMPGPDFPTAGLILGKKGIRQAYETGRGSVVMQGKATIEPGDGGRNVIVITELPFQVNKARLQEQIAALARAGKIVGITDLPDYSDRNGIRLEVHLRRDAQPKKVLNYLYKHTPLRSTFGVNMLALVNGEPKVLGVKRIIELYIEHRKDVVTRRTRFLLNKAQARAHILEGLRIALDFIDEVIALIRASDTTDAARRGLVDRFGLTVIQANAILEMQLRQLVNLERKRIDDEYRELLKTIAALEEILNDPRKLLAVIRQETKTLRDKLGDERKTRILATEAEEITDDALIPEEEMIITITRDGYIKRVPIDTYRPQGRGGRGIMGGKSKEKDEIAHLFVATTHHYILFFTNKGRVYRLKAYDIPLASRTAIGTAVINLIGLDGDEQVTATIPIQGMDEDGYLVMASELGEIKRTAISEFRNLKNVGIKAFDIEENDNLRWVQHTDGKDEIFIVTRHGMSIHFNEKDVPSRGRAAGGVKGITLNEGDQVVCMELCSKGDQLLVASENAYGKRTLISEYRKQGRGGRGIQTMQITAKTGVIIGCAVVNEQDNLLLMTSNGVAMQTTVESIRRTGRSAQGVKLQNVGEDDRLASIERVTPQMLPTADGPQRVLTPDGKESASLAEA